NTLRSAPTVEESEKFEKQCLTRSGWKLNIRSLATTQKTGNGSECCNCSLTIYQTICVGTRRTYHKKYIFEKS
ncbi:hypothetical protein Q4S22_11960, partial [Morganella morganii]